MFQKIFNFIGKMQNNAKFVECKDVDIKSFKI